MKGRKHTLGGDRPEVAGGGRHPGHRLTHITRSHQVKSLQSGVRPEEAST
jgi:hypothetical protein